MEGGEFGGMGGLTGKEGRGRGWVLDGFYRDAVAVEHIGGG